MTGEKLNENIRLIGDTIIRKSKKIQSDNNTIVLVICVLISTLFWFLKALNDEYKTDVEFPIEFVNIPDNYQFYGDVPQKLTVTIQDDGFTIMRYKFSYVFLSLKFDVSKYFKKNQELTADGTIDISPAALNKSIEGELIPSSDLLDVYPESINILYSKYQEIKLPISVVADIDTEQQHIVSGNIMTYPDSIVVIGSGKLLAETPVIYTQPVRAHNLQDSLIRNVALQPIEGLKYKIKKVKLVVPVESFTQKIVDVPIVGRNFPDSLNVRTFPGFAKVSCICGLSMYNTIHPSDFQCYIDFSQVKNLSNGHTDLNVMTTNVSAQRVFLKQKSVDYLIEKQ